MPQSVLLHLVRLLLLLLGLLLLGLLVPTTAAWTGRMLLLLLVQAAPGAARTRAALAPQLTPAPLLPSAQSLETLPHAAAPTGLGYQAQER
jgi:hypothetical protein